MKPVVVTGPPRADAAVVAELGELGVATVHEAGGKAGLLGTGLRPVWAGARAAGTAVTVLCGPGDNLMLHAGIEQAGAGDLIVLTTTSPSSDGFVGELIVTSLIARGVTGLVTTTGVRDIAAIRAAGFGVWSRHVSAQGTLKATAGCVNVPVVIGGVVVHPGDAVVADDDGVVCVPRLDVGKAVSASAARIAKEDTNRKALADGQLGLDMYGLRAKLGKVEYITAAEYARRAGEGAS